MGPIGDGWMALVLIIVGAVLPTEIWRWLGLVIGGRINPRSDVLFFVRATATGIIAAFVARAVLFPVGVLANVPVWLRVAALLSALAAYALLGRHIIAGVAAGVAALLAGMLLLSG